MVRGYSMSTKSLTDKLEFFRDMYLSISLDIALKYSIIGLILVIALYVRLLPLRFGAYISEFDPYLQYYATKVIVKGVESKGLVGIFEFFNHHIPLTWQPEGVDLGLRYYPGVPYIGAITYLFLKLIGVGVTLEEVAIFLPVVFGVIGTLVVYLIGKEVGDEFTGFIAAFFYSLSPAVIPRSNLGWYDTDGFGMPLLLISILMFIKSMKSEEKREKILFSIFSGIFAGLLGSTWGAFIYLYIMYALFTIVLVLLSLLPKNYELTYIPMYLIATFIVTSVPRNKLTYLVGTSAILQYIAIALIFLYKYVDLKAYTKSIWKLISAVLLISLGGAILLSVAPLDIKGKLLAVILPNYEGIPTVVRTVQEQAGASFVYFYRGFFILIPFALYGFYLFLREKDPRKIFIILFSLTSIYVASNFVRLIVLAAPFIMILGGYGMKAFLGMMFEKSFEPQKSYKKKYSDTSVSLKTQILVVSLIIILVGTYYSYSVGVRSATYPVTILTGGNPFGQISYDWIEALEWMKANIPNESIVAAWWDYGYWISFIAGKKTLADNGTLNQTRIRLLAEMFLSDEDRAIEIMHQLGAEYIVIYLGTIDVSSQQGPTYTLLYGFGEEGKFIQMAKIAGKDPDIYINRTNTEGSIYTDAFWNTFLGKLIPYKFVQKQNVNNQPTDIYQYSPNYPTKPDGQSKLILVYKTSDPGYGEVLIYKLVDS